MSFVNLPPCDPKAPPSYSIAATIPPTPPAAAHAAPATCETSDTDSSDETHEINFKAYVPRQTPHAQPPRKFTSNVSMINITHYKPSAKPPGSTKRVLDTYSSFQLDRFEGQKQSKRIPLEELAPLYLSPAILQAIDPTGTESVPVIGPVIIIPTGSESKTLFLIHSLTKDETKAVAAILLLFDQRLKGWNSIWNQPLDKPNNEELVIDLLKAFLTSKDSATEREFTQHYVNLCELLLNREAISTAFIANLTMAMVFAESQILFDEAFCKNLHPLRTFFPALLISLENTHQQRLAARPHLCASFFEKLRSHIPTNHIRQYHLEQLLRQLLTYVMVRDVDREKLLASTLLTYLLNTLTTQEPREIETVKIIVKMVKLPLEGPSYHAFLGTIVSWIVTGKMYMDAKRDEGLKKFLDQYLHEKPHPLNRLHNILRLVPNQQATLVNLVTICEKARVKRFKNGILISIACRTQLIFQFEQNDLLKALLDSLKELEDHPDYLNDAFDIIHLFLIQKDNYTLKQQPINLFLSRMKEFLAENKGEAYCKLLEPLKQIFA